MPGSTSPWTPPIPTGPAATCPTRDRGSCGGRFYEAAKCSARPAAPDYAYYRSVKLRHDGKLAALAVARKLARRCYHTLRGVDPEEVYATV